MSIGVGLGLAGYPFSGPRAFWRWVELLEEGGVDSLWQSDRLVSPQPALEPMALMAALAGGTERLKFGMNVVVLPLRDPLLLAKQCATIDHLSGGRLLPAFGVGNARSPDWDAVGLSPRGRGARADEALELLTRLWAEREVSFEGEHYRLSGVTIEPRPVQQPLPLWIGGDSEAAIRRTARVGSGWLGGLHTIARTKETVAAIRRAAAEAGRPIDDDHYGATFAFRFGSTDDASVERAAAPLRRLGDEVLAGYLAVGDAGAIVRRLEEFVAAGVSKFVLRPLADDDAGMLDQSRRLIEEVLPVVAGWNARAAGPAPS
jgi:probable F420-dependent oxidoreductase